MRRYQVTKLELRTLNLEQPETRFPTWQSTLTPYALRLKPEPINTVAILNSYDIGYWIFR